jgi:hypothetical protein
MRVSERVLVMTGACIWVGCAQMNIKITALQ